MELGRLYSENKRCKTLSQVLAATGMAILFFAFSSLISVFSISEINPELVDLRQEKLSSSNDHYAEVEFPFAVGLEVEESKEEKKDGPPETFTFCSPNCHLTGNASFFTNEILSENWTASTPSIPLYLLFHNLRVHLS